MFSRRRKRREEALRDADLFHHVRAIVHEELGELIESGRVVLEEREPDGIQSGELELKPTRSGATPLYIGADSDVVSFGVGQAGAWSEFWSITPGWDSALREVVQCVRDGRYSERVHKGWVFPLKVKMRFSSVPSGWGPWRSNDYVIRYASTLSAEEGPLPMPPEGQFTFEPW